MHENSVKASFISKEITCSKEPLERVTVVSKAFHSTEFHLLCSFHYAPLSKRELSQAWNSFNVSFDLKNSKTWAFIISCHANSLAFGASKPDSKIVIYLHTIFLCVLTWKGFLSMENSHKSCSFFFCLETTKKKFHFSDVKALLHADFHNWKS